MGLLYRMARPHLFIQLGTYDLSELAAHLERLHGMGSNRVDLIVTFTGRRGDGALYEEHLDVLDPYLPWGEKAVAANVFFGTQVIDYSGLTDTWGTAITSEQVRWDLIGQQWRVAQRLHFRYQGHPIHWYIEHEAALDKLADPAIRAGYEAFLIQSVRDFHRLRPGASVAWSPAFFRRLPQPGLAASLHAMFEKVASLGGGGGIDWILLQDMCGRDWLNPLPADVKVWMDTLGTSFRSKQVNPEQFSKVNGQLVPGDPVKLAARVKEYARLGLQVGAAWEMRWLMRQQAAPAPAPAPKPSPITDTLVAVTKSYKGASWPRLAAHNTWESRRAQVAGWLKDGVHRGAYSERAEVADDLGLRLHKITGLAVQGRRYMRPYTPNPSTGRAVNSDHLTAGALDIFLKTEAEKKWLPYLYETFRILEERGVVRYVVELGANPAHWDHIHVSLQIGCKK